MARVALILLLAGLPALPAWSETDFTRLTPAERAIFHAEIRAALLGLPREALPDAPAPPIDLYADEAANDLDRIAAAWSVLTDSNLPGFGPEEAGTTIALMIAPDCPDCARAEAGLRELAQEYDLRVTLVEMEAHRALTDRLGIDLAPTYVFKDKMLRGELPAIVLRKYLD
ncbi:thioredoxin family protein [Roseovarius sp. SCSIO 43702]|uniref:thioredoxin family protein n=1 Tax=Roseovarius sp. SCSIO 43702 TaxID=2823043 RepID=UPI001C730BD4|nr:thioredoxin family protein [Roseovarius sp. SCSIO 43702]QYX55326.1 thioredoxin family protein [Roseovarius sp. SCSIO 43702]